MVTFADKEAIPLRPTRAVINLGALDHNYREIKGRLPKGVGILAVVKADAYGHGSIEVSRRLEALGCEFLGVALCEEGVRLREAGIKIPILVLSGFFESQVEVLTRFNLTPVVFDPSHLHLLNRVGEKEGRRIGVHLKVDTGMGRLGLLPEEVPSFIEELESFPYIYLEGLLSHLAEAEDEEGTFSKEQVERFERVLQILRRSRLNPLYVHIANSAAIFTLPSFLFNLVRPGIMLYGSYPSEALRRKVTLKPLMTLTTRILQVKRVGKRVPISYGREFVTERESLIGVIPIGYGDGLPRSLSNRGYVLVRGRRVPIVGRICMDLTMIDLTDVGEVSVNEEVVVIGRQWGEEITIEEFAELSGTISYEAFCRIGSRVPREYIRS